MERATELDIRLDRSGPLPLYYQIARELERAIAEGRLAKGDFLDNEILLADEWRLSRLTVRRAIQELVDSGLLVRRRGVGTQVVNDQVPRPARLGSLFDDLTERGRHPTTSVLAHERVVADDLVAEQLALAPGSTVVYVERCRYADGKRLAVLRNWLTVAAAADITTDELLQTGLYVLLRDRGIWPHSSWRRLTARNAGPVDAALLDVAVGAPVLVVEATMQDKTGNRIEVSEQIHDGASYTMELSVVES